jgi:putative tricarboxylic transport membrane protein
MRRYDFLSGLFLLALSLVICIGSLRLQVGTLTEPASGFFPLVTGLVLALFSIGILWGAWKESRAPVEFWASDANKKGVYLALLSILFYTLFLEPLGFVVTTILFFTLFSRFVSGHRWTTAVFFGFAASLATYLVFNYLLHAPLPPGVTGRIL